MVISGYQRIVQSMSLSYKTKADPSAKSREVRIEFDPPLAGYEEVKPRLLAMTADAQESLGMVRAKFTLFVFAHRDHTRTTVQGSPNIRFQAHTRSILPHPRAAPARLYDRRAVLRRHRVGRGPGIAPHVWRGHDVQVAMGTRRRNTWPGGVVCPTPVYETSDGSCCWSELL